MRNGNRSLDMIWAASLGNQVFSTFTNFNRGISILSEKSDLRVLGLYNKDDADVIHSKREIVNGTPLDKRIIPIPRKDNFLSSIQPDGIQLLENPKSVSRHIEAILMASSWTLTSPGVVLPVLSRICKASGVSNIGIYRLVNIVRDSLSFSEVLESIDFGNELMDAMDRNILTASYDYMDFKTDRITEGLAVLPAGEVRMILASILTDLESTFRVVSADRREGMCNHWESAVMRQIPMNINNLLNVEPKKVTCSEILSIDLSSESHTPGTKAFFFLLHSNNGILSDIHGVLREERVLPEVCHLIIISKVLEFWKQYSHHEHSTKKRSHKSLALELPHFFMDISHKLWALALMTALDGIRHAQLIHDHSHIGNTPDFKKLSQLPITELPSVSLIRRVFQLSNPSASDQSEWKQLKQADSLTSAPLIPTLTTVTRHTQTCTKLSGNDYSAGILVRDPHIRWLYSGLIKILHKGYSSNHETYRNILLDWSTAIQLSNAIAFPLRSLQSWLLSVRRSKMLDFVITQESIEALSDEIRSLADSPSASQETDSEKIKCHKVVAVFAPNSSEIVYHLFKQEFLKEAEKRQNGIPNGTVTRFIPIDMKLDRSDGSPDDVINVTRESSYTEKELIPDMINEANIFVNISDVAPRRSNYTGTWGFPSSARFVRIHSSIGNHKSWTNSTSEEYNWKPRSSYWSLNKKCNVDDSRKSKSSQTCTDAILDALRPDLAIVIGLPLGVDNITPAIRKSETVGKYILIGTRDQGTQYGTWGRRPIGYPASRIASRIGILQSQGWKIDGDIKNVTRHIANVFEDRTASGELAGSISHSICHCYKYYRKYSIHYKNTKIMYRFIFRCRRRSLLILSYESDTSITL